MSQTSSTSSFDERGVRAYLVRIVLLTAVMIAAAVTIAAYGITHQAIVWNDTQLLRYQTDKLKMQKM